MYNENMNILGAKILIVEDEPQINRLIELVLLSDGFYNVKKSFDGAEALESIKSEKPDLILLDVMLPSLDGFTLCKKIKEDEYLKNIQVIMLTAKKMEEDVLEGFESVAEEFRFRVRVIDATLSKEEIRDKIIQEIEWHFKKRGI